jgi:acetyl-CoA synthetase
VVSSGEPLDPEIIGHVQKRWGLTVRDGYGQTETTALIGNTPGQRVKPGAMGRPLPGYRLALLDADGNEGDEGEIALRLDPRPTGLMLGYQDWNRTVDPATEGYYRTRDVAARDADGYFTYVGRADDVFKSSEYRISPFELESVLAEHEAVAEAAVVPSPDELRLAVPKIVVELADGFAPTGMLAQELLRFARARLAPYKRIRRIEFAELPKTLSGKIRRVELRKREDELRGSNQRGELEFWEEDFPALADAEA